MIQLEKVKVLLAERSYEIKIGQGLLSSIGHEMAGLVQGKQVVVITNENIPVRYREKVVHSLKEKGFAVLIQVIPDGEEYKSWQMAEEILSQLLKARFNRDATVIALGGGVIGDLAGFVASVYQRGIDFMQIPTTLLAQVDSSVGGKVAVNHPLGKNMIGSFYQPLEVWIDVDTLVTLPEREWKAGLAEIVKYGVIWDGEFFEFLETNVELINSRDLKIMKEIIKRCCQIKGSIVGQDEREQELRTILNFGHTIGHGLENVTQYKTYRHGEAVAIGMVLASKLSVKLDMCTQELVDRLEKVLMSLGLPTNLPAQISIKQITEAMLLDKKIRDGKLVFVLPKTMGEVEIMQGIPLDYLQNFLESEVVHG